MYVYMCVGEREREKKVDDEGVMLGEINTHTHTHIHTPATKYVPSCGISVCVFNILKASS
jgi:hypothetical protein